MLFVCIYYLATNSKRLPISDTLSQPALFFSFLSQSPTPGGNANKKSFRLWKNN